MPDIPSPRFAVLATAAIAFPQAVKRLADHQEYLVRARTIGASKEDAERVLAEVITELATTGAPGNAYTIAYRRLLDIDAGIARPRESVRDTARQLLRCEGAPEDPEGVDRTARWLMRFAEQWSQSSTAALAAAVEPPRSTVADVIDLQGNSDGKRCATCNRTYGIPVDDPQRCGCCLTGLSLDGIPVHPAQAPDGSWYSPVTGPGSGEVVQLADGTWTFLIEPFEMFGSREEQIARREAQRAAGEW